MWVLALPVVRSSVAASMAKWGPPVPTFLRLQRSVCLGVALHSAGLPDHDEVVPCLVLGLCSSLRPRVVPVARPST